MMKRILATVMAITMSFCAVVTPLTAIADEKNEAATKSSIENADEKSADITPVILVPGVGSSALYKNPDGDKESAIGFDDSIFQTVKDTQIIRDFFKIIRGKGKKINPLTFINKLSAITKPFCDMNCDVNGDSLNNIGIDCYWTDPLSNHIDYLDSRQTAEPAICKIISDKIGAENVWIFNYDFRLDVVGDSDKLSEFIDSVKQQSGKNQVTLVSASLGTAVVSSYIDRYKDKNDIERCLFLDGAFCGTSLGKLFKKDVAVSKDAISEYLNILAKFYMSDVTDYGKINKWFKIFDKTVTRFSSFFGTLTEGENLDALYIRVILPILGNIPALWECIPYDDFDEAVATIKSLGYLDENSGLYKKITTYHDIQGRLTSNIKALQEKGVQVAIVCGYGLPQIPFTSYANMQSDMLIDTCYASIGATVAKAGEKIDNATSPDGLINSSTCAFENNTWFIRSVQHMEFIYGTNVNEFVGYLATTNTKATIESVNKETGYNQFLAIDHAYVMSNVK